MSRGVHPTLAVTHPMLINLLLALAAAIAVVIVLAMTKPAIFSVTRSTTTSASPAKLQPMVSDFHAWGAWSPWEHIDPAMNRTFSGASSGRGAIYEWNGNNKVGAGRMEVLDEVPGASVKVKLDFIRPFEGHNVTTFTFTPGADGTTVRWEMTGPNSFMGKVMSVFVNMDKMIGKDFEAGLANLKRVAEV